MHFCPMSMYPVKYVKARDITRKPWRSAIRGKTIADILDMTVDDALGVFQKHT